MINTADLVNILEKNIIPDLILDPDPIGRTVNLTLPEVWSGPTSDEGSLRERILEELQEVCTHYVFILKKIICDDFVWYSWFDEQAKQLRLCWINKDFEKLPFGAKVVYAQSLEQIVDVIRQQVSLSVISWNELDEIGELPRLLEEVDSDETINYEVIVYLENVRK